MSPEQDSSGSEKPGSEKSEDCPPQFAASPCRLADLVRRPQIDFEIDFFERILSRDPNYLEVLANLGELFSRRGCHRRALQVDQRLAQLRPQDPVVAYNLACSYAVLRQAPEALDTLRRAIELGYDDLEHMLGDPDLAPLHSHPEYLRLLQELDTAPVNTRVV